MFKISLDCRTILLEALRFIERPSVCMVSTMEQVAKEKYDQKVRNLYLALAWVSGSIMLITAVYGVGEALREYLTTGIVTVGQTLVEVDFPFPYFAKPITYLSVAIVVFFYSIVKGFEQRITQISDFRKAALSVFALVMAFTSIYEVFYNFAVWNALLTAEVFAGRINPDVLRVNYPDPKAPWNLVFATKIFFSAAIASLLSFYSLRKTRVRQAIRLTR